MGMQKQVAFFPRPLVLRLVTWRENLRAAIGRSGMKQSVIALDAGITPETLSRILTAEHQRPSLDTIARIAHAVHENVGWILDERAFTLSGDETRQLRQVVRFLDKALLDAPPPRVIVRATSNALKVTARRREIPKPLTALGARLVYQVTDDSLREAGVIDGDTVYVKPQTDLMACAGLLALIEVGGEPFAKHLEVKGDRIRLLSRNDRYAPLDVHETEIEVIGIIVGRLGVPSAEC
jgi:SOS-response transcriptional repressor LexA